MDIIEIRCNKPYILIIYLDDKNKYLVGETYLSEIKMIQDTPDQAEIVLKTRFVKGKKGKKIKNT